MLNSMSVYVDGSCWPNPNGPGGWAWVRIPSTGPTVTARGGIPSPSTNNRAELCAVIAALRALPADSRHVTVVSDSQYALGLVHLAVAKLPFAKRYKNPDLLELLGLALARFTHPPCFEWVRGHSGVAGNERADQLAERARQEVSSVK